MLLNFGGFVPLSTVDWRGRAVCTVFFRGCSARCFYCHNQHLQRGENRVSTDYIMGLIEENKLLISGVVFSGGECTEQPEPLRRLAEDCRGQGLKVAIHTNGAFPEHVPRLIGEVDKVSLDIKAAWPHYYEVTDLNCARHVQASLARYRDAHTAGTLPEFEIVHTVIRGHEAEVPAVAAAAEGVDLVLQQGIWGREPPLTLAEFQALADQLPRPVRIRAKEIGEVLYRDGVFTVAGSIKVTDPERLAAYYKGGVRRGD
jgi:pyruvate formate lyase activating enzyme